jgi:hypothetical protein
MSFPPGTEMFQFPGFASPHYVFMRRYPKGVGFPIRTSMDQSLLAAPHGFSQRATSFIASWCQGIHRMPLSRSRSLSPNCFRNPGTRHAQEPSTPTRDTTDRRVNSTTHNKPYSAHNITHASERHSAALGFPPVRHGLQHAQRRTRT